MLGAPAYAQGWGLTELMRSLAQVKSAQAQFTQTETSPVLSAPLASRGTLSYVAPDYLRKTTTAPAREVFVLDHGVVTLSGPEGRHVFPLDADPRIAGLIEGISATLAGNLPALERDYTVSLSGDAQSWRLTLRPRGAELARFIRLMNISGSGRRIAVIDTLAADGARTQMVIDAP